MNMASLRVPVSFDQPVRTTEETKAIDYTFLRATVDPVFGVVAYQGPPVDEIWDVHSIQIELSCSIDEGTREVWIYLLDRANKIVRYQAFAATKGNSYTHISQYGQGISSNSAAGIPYTNFVYTGPLYVQTLQPPCKIGVLLTGFNSATDTRHYSIVYRSRKR